MINGELIVDNFAGGADAEHEHRGRADRAAEVRVMNVAEGLKKRSE